MKDDLMVQQQVKSVWQHMVGVMCLNMTYRKQVKRILPILFEKYPNPKAAKMGKPKSFIIFTIVSVISLFLHPPSLR